MTLRNLAAVCLGPLVPLFLLLAWQVAANHWGIIPPLEVVDKLGRRLDLPADGSKAGRITSILLILAALLLLLWSIT